MNFLFLAHCHLLTSESNITCWASGTSREGGQCCAELTGSTVLHLLADGFYLLCSFQVNVSDIGSHAAAAMGAASHIPECLEK